MGVGRGKSILIAMLIVGCGSDPKEEGTKGPSEDSATLRDDKAVGELTASERESLCAALDQAEEPIVDAFDQELCTWQALIAETLAVSSCDSYLTSCLEDEDDEGEESEGAEDDEADDCPVTSRTSCRNVTVQDVKECNDALLARDKRAGERIRELKLTCGDELPADLELAVPARCQALLDRCPSLAIEREVD